MVARVFAAAALLSVAALVGAASAPASELIDRNATGVGLAVDKQGRALLTYRARGRTWHVLASGAVDARPPHPKAKQVAFRLDYSGGWGTYKRDVWKTLKNTCRPYDGPALKWFVTGCKAADGSYWALQRWQRLLPHRGFPGWLPGQAA